LGSNLPKDYLDFVTKHNGGEPQANTFPIDRNGNESGVSEFIALENVPEELELGGFNVLPGFLPFAFAEGGNYVCIEITTGNVFFWDHELEPDRGGLVKLAEAIPPFLELLTPFDPSTIKLKPGQVKSAWIDPNLLNVL
jgi:hypothetical protein